MSKSLSDEIREQSHDEEGARNQTPLWETLAMIASFVLLWLWFWVRQNTLRVPGAEMSPLWQLVMIGALLVLVVIMFRRLKRVRQALQEENEKPFGGTYPGIPYGAPPPDQRKK